MELETLQNNIIVVVALAVLAGLLIGWLLTYLLIGRGPSKTELTGKLAAVEEEFETHKESVDKHFATTSELVNELTESYVKVYKHLSDGAEQLSGVVDMRNRLTLDDAEKDVISDSAADGPEGSNDDGNVIEGALAATAAFAATDATGNISAEMARAEDPEFTVSDEAVAETLTELEVSATKATNQTADAKPSNEPPLKQDKA